MAVFPDYEPEIDSATAERLELEGSEDALMLAVVTLGDTVADATLNLLGPIVVNRHTNRAAQAVPAGPSCELSELRTPFVTR
jgi:flagellar assembly factor FliW